LVNVGPSPSGFVALSLEVEGEELLGRMFSRFGEGVSDFSPAFVLMREELYQIERQQFETQGSRSGGWASLAESTVKRKGFDTIMVASRRLFKSLTGSGGDNVADITPTQLTFGTKVPYGIYHQSPAPRVRLPRRPIIAFNDEDRKAMTKLMQRYLVGVAREAEADAKNQAFLGARAIDIIGGPA